MPINLLQSIEISILFAVEHRATFTETKKKVVYVQIVANGMTNAVCLLVVLQGKTFSLLDRQQQ